jgi:CheY-like chemotaxis protein
VCPPCCQLNLRLITRLLQLQDFGVTAVADGGAALDALRANYDAAAAASSIDAAAVPFDLAIFDMSMPVRTLPAHQCACAECTRRVVTPA